VLDHVVDLLSRADVVRKRDAAPACAVVGDSRVCGQLRPIPQRDDDAVRLVERRILNLERRRPAERTVKRLCPFAVGDAERDQGDARSASSGPNLPGRRLRVESITVADLIYSAIASLDGYIADEAGNFRWAAPDEEVHAFVNELERPVGTYLYGRRMYETMVFWESPPDLAAEPRVMREYAEIWQAAEKIVYSRTLSAVAGARTRIEREFEPEAITQLKATAAGDISVGGPELAAEAIAAGLVDEYQLFLVPVVVGGGKRALPEIRLDLELLDERRFGNGTVYLRYRTRRQAISGAALNDAPAAV